MSRHLALAQKIDYMAKMAYQYENDVSGIEKKCNCKFIYSFLEC